MAKAKQVAHLDCHLDARAQAVKILRSRLDEMCELRGAALNFADIEGVHDMRVASRRLRSAFADFAGVFDTDDFKIVEREAKRLARALGAVRDEDVAIAALEKFNREVNKTHHAEIKSGIKTLIAERTVTRETGRQDLRLAIDETHLDNLRSRFDAFAAHYETPPDTAHRKKESSDKPKSAAKKTSAKKASIKNTHDVDSHTETLHQAGRRILQARWNKLQKQIRSSIYRPLDSEPLHEARIEAKRMRYALELFNFCWNDALAPLAKQISEMQSALGEVHDLDDWIIKFGNRLTPKKFGKNLDTTHPNALDDMTDTERAAAWLLDICIERRTKFYREALDIWLAWQNENFAAQLNEQLSLDLPSGDKSKPRAAQTEIEKHSSERPAAKIADTAN